MISSSYIITNSLKRKTFDQYPISILVETYGVNGILGILWVGLDKLNLIFHKVEHFVKPS